MLILGAGPTGICTLLCVMLHSPKRIIVCEKDASRLQFIRQHYPQVLTVQPEDCAAFVRAHSDHGGADVVLEVAGADSTFRLAWECARPNAVVTVVALYDKAQTLPLPEMYGKTSPLRPAAWTAAIVKKRCVSSQKARSIPNRSSPTPTPCAGSQRATSCLKRNGTA